jgi:uncharacterized protein (TIGR02594 family)
MPVPTQYKYLLKADMPKVIQAAIKLYDTTEITGKKHNSVILGWAKTLGIDKIYTNDELAWCGLAHAICLLRGGKPASLEGWDILRALKYATYGMGVAKPGVGDTLVFKRTGGGHVGFYAAESKNTYHVLGGNQKNAYNIVEIEKKRLIAARSPIYNLRPATAIPMYMDSTGNISCNES